MKTHEFADALMVMAKMLKAGRNVELKNWPGPVQVAADRNGTDANDTGLSLSLLASLSRVSKAQWRSLIEEWKLPVEVYSSDSKRDLVGRVLRFLEENPSALRKLAAESAKKGTKSSPELLKALSILLGEDASEEGE